MFPLREPFESWIEDERQLAMNSVIKFFLATLVLLSSLSIHGQEEVTEPTIITSKRLEMQGTEERNYFYFSGEVLVKGTNLEIRCDELTVVSMREGPEGATIGDIGAIDQIVAQGSVEIHQAGRSAYAGRAEVDPVAGTVTLSENPRIIDRDVEVSGYQFVLHKDERKFVSVPDPNAPADRPSRSVVSLGAMPDLGFNQEEADITVDDQINDEPSGETGNPAIQDKGGPHDEGP